MEVKFAEWIRENKWQNFYHSRPGVWARYVGDFKYEEKTTEELFEIFKSDTEWEQKN